MKPLKLFVMLLLMVFLASNVFGGDCAETSDPRNDFEKKFIYVLVEQFGVDSKKISPGTNLRDDLGADNTDLVELCMAVEEYFDIHINDESWWAVTTIESAVDLILDVKNSNIWYEK